MSDDIVIRIKTLLEKASQEDLNKVKSDIEQRVNPKIKIDVDSKGLDKYKEKYVDMQNSVSGITQKTKEWTKTNGETVKQIDNIKAGTNEVYRRVTETTVNYKKQRDEIEKTTNQIQKQNIAQEKMLNTIRGMRGINGAFITGDNLSNLNTLENRIKSFNPADKDFAQNMRNAQLELQKINTTMGIYKKEVQDANKFTGVFGQSLLEAGKKFASWLFIGNIIIGVATAIKTGIQSITDIDTALTNLNKVTDETRETLSKFSLEANAIGRELAKTSVEVINSTTEFARLGYSLEQSAQLAKQALLYSNVGDIGVEQASLAIISAVKGFGVEVDSTGKNIQKIVDIYNEVGNNFAISSAGIGEAMRRSAASLYAAGNTIEEAVAMITAANAVVQDPTMVGTALKTVSMRIRGITDEGEEIQDLVPKLESAFRNIGIEIKKDNETFKSTYELMNDLARVWENLTDLQKANITELVAGKRQGNIVVSMLNNWEDATDSLTSALNSTNSALIENEKYMESIEAKSAQFKNTVMGKWQGALDSNVIKGFVVAMTNLVEVFGNLEVIITLATTALLLWKGTAITSAVKAMVTFIATTNTANVSLLAMLVTTQGLTKAMQFLTATMASNPLGLLAVVATTTMVAFYGLTNATKKHREEQQKQIEASQNQIQTLKQQQNGLKELSDEYEFLKNKENITIEEKKRLLEIQKELVNKYNVSATGINLEGEAYANSTEAIKLRTLALEEEITKEKEKLKLNILSADALNTEDIRSNTKKRDKAQKKIETAIKVLPYLEENDPYSANLKKEQIKNFEKDIEEANSVIQEAAKNRRKYLEYDAQETIKSLESNGKKMSDSAKLVVSEFAKSLALQPKDIEDQQQALSDFATKVANSELDALIEKYNKFISDINSGDDSKKNRDGLSKTSKEITNLINTLTKSNPDLKEFAINFASLYPSTIDVKNTINTLDQYEKALLDFQTAYKDNVSKIKDLKGFLDELSDKGLTQSSIEKIISDYQDYIPLLEDESKLRQQLVKDTEDYQNAIYDAYAKAKSEDAKFFENIKNNNRVLFDNLSNFYKTDANNWTTLAQTKEVINSNLIKTLGDQWEKYFSAFQAGETISYSDYNKLSGIAKLKDPRTPLPDNVVKQFQFLDELNKASRKQAEAFKNLNVSSGLGKSGGSKSSKEFTKTFEVWKELLEAVNTELETLKDQLDDVTSFEQKTEIYDQMILLLEKKQNLLLDISKTFDSNLQQAEQNLRSYIGKGLSESDFNKIMSGSTDTIEVDIKNEKIAKAIEDFKKLKDSAEGLKKEIQGIDDEIRDLSFAEFKINLSIEDTKLSDLTQEKENLRNEMSLLEKGSAEYIALLERENQINIESVNILRNKIALVQQELASDRYNADQKKELINILKQLKQEYINLQFSIKQELASIADEIIQIYKNIYEKQKDFALDAIDEQMDAEEKRHKQATNNLDDELKQFEDYISARINALDRAENEHDYNRELEKKQKARQELLDKIGLLSMDDSIEAKLELAELDKQLAQQEDEIAEYQHDHSVDLRKDNLKDQLDAYKKDIDAKKKTEDTKLNLEKDRLDRIKKETERHYDELINDERKFAQIKTDIINGNIDDVKNAFGNFKTFVNGNLEFLGNSITANLIAKMEQAMAMLQSYQSQSSSIPNIPDESFTGGNDTGGAKTGLVKPGMLLTEAAAIAGVSVVYHSEDNTVTIGNLPTRFSPAGIGGTHLNSQNRIVIDEIENIKRLLKMAGGDVSKFHDGGVVGSESFGFVDKFNKFFNTSANEHIIKALTNEILIPPKNIERYLIPNMQKLIANVTPQLQFAGGGNTNYYLNLRIDNVTGDKRGGETVFREVVRGLKSIGK